MAGTHKKAAKIQIINSTKWVGARLKRDLLTIFESLVDSLLNEYLYLNGFETIKFKDKVFVLVLNVFKINYLLYIDHS